MANLEQIVEIVHNLPPVEQDKLFEIMKAERQQADNQSLPENANTDHIITAEMSETSEQRQLQRFKLTQLRDNEERFNKSLEWVRVHREEYDGQWVVLEGDELIAHGSDGKQVYEEARAKGIETPFLKRVKAKELPFGGW